MSNIIFTVLKPFKPFTVELIDLLNMYPTPLNNGSTNHTAQISIPQNEIQSVVYSVVSGAALTFTNTVPTDKGQVLIEGLLNGSTYTIKVLVTSVTGATAETFAELSVLSAPNVNVGNTSANFVYNSENPIEENVEVLTLNLFNSNYTNTGSAPVVSTYPLQEIEFVDIQNTKIKRPNGSFLASGDVLLISEISSLRFYKEGSNEGENTSDYSKVISFYAIDSLGFKSNLATSTFTLINKTPTAPEVSVSQLKRAGDNQVIGAFGTDINADDSVNPMPFSFDTTVNTFDGELAAYTIDLVSTDGQRLFSVSGDVGNGQTITTTLPGDLFSSKTVNPYNYEVEIVITGYDTNLETELLKDLQLINTRAPYSTSGVTNPSYTKEDENAEYEVTFTSEGDVLYIDLDPQQGVRQLVLVDSNNNTIHTKLGIQDGDPYFVAIVRNIVVGETYRLKVKSSNLTELNQAEFTLNIGTNPNLNPSYEVAIVI